MMKGRSRGSIALAALVANACIRAPLLPSPPFTVAAAAEVDDSTRALAKRLAPTLYLQRDEPFPLLRVAAIVHSSKPVIAYHFLWAHDVNGQWVPWAKPSDEEEVWVGYDPTTYEATDIWTYWHDTILHTDWRGRGAPAIDVQWGKHGSLPRGVIESDLPRGKTLNGFYAIEFALLPDIWLGRLAHGGPWGFLGSYSRYRDFSNAIPLTDRLDLIAKTSEPREALRAVFGPRYSNKTHWPFE